MTDTPTLVEPNDDDPFGVEKDPQWIAFLSLLAKALAFGALAVLALWISSAVLKDPAGLVEIEISALQALQATLFASAGAVAMSWALVVPILVCVASVVYITVAETKYRKKVVREWKWVWKSLNGLWYEKILGAVGAVLTLFESVVYVAVTVTSVVAVAVNIWTIKGWTGL